MFLDFCSHCCADPNAFGKANLEGTILELKWGKGTVAEGHREFTRTSFDL